VIEAEAALIVIIDADLGEFINLVWRVGERESCSALRAIGLIRDGGIILLGDCFELSGIEATIRIREMGYTLPIVALSASANGNGRRAIGKSTRGASRPTSDI